MIRNSLFLSATALLLALFGLMNRLSFLAGMKKPLFLHCGGSMGLFVSALGLNLFAAALAFNRKLFLKDTGRKLSHFDNQLQSEGAETLPRIFEEKR
jgi:hypothetical protein